MTRRSTTRGEEPRRERVPMGVPRAKLTVQNKEPGYAYRWINDAPGRIAQAQQAGYEFVTDGQTTTGDTGESNTDLGTQVSAIVGTHEDGSTMRAYLMRIPEQYYREDQAMKQSEIDKIDESVRQGAIGKEHGDGHTYIPDRGIRYE